LEKSEARLRVVQYGVVNILISYLLLVCFFENVFGRKFVKALESFSQENLQIQLNYGRCHLYSERSQAKRLFQNTELDLEPEFANSNFS
jgi:hypothetical protein